ncbi:hypothetical protein [Sphingomonas sp. LB3N6]|uniref:hypothetical protein n=1 Tax=Sphingomonas fucosidasi TaxID=3096164 RepID=UPI003FA74234
MRRADERLHLLDAPRLGEPLNIAPAKRQQRDVAGFGSGLLPLLLLSALPEREVSEILLAQPLLRFRRGERLEKEIPIHRQGPRRQDDSNAPHMAFEVVGHIAQRSPELPLGQVELIDRIEEDSCDLAICSFPCFQSFIFRWRSQMPPRLCGDRCQLDIKGRFALLPK